MIRPFPPEQFLLFDALSPVGVRQAVPELCELHAWHTDELWNGTVGAPECAGRGHVLVGAYADGPCHGPHLLGNYSYRPAEPG